jgi:hypothetical protein
LALPLLNLADFGFPAIIRFIGSQTGADRQRQRDGTTQREFHAPILASSGFHATTRRAHSKPSRSAGRAGAAAQAHASRRAGFDG